MWVLSDFQENDEGWTVVGDAQGTSVIPDWKWDADNGNGYISAKDDVVGGHWYWKAPQKFLGDMSGAYGYTLTYSLRQSNIDRQWIIAPHVILSGSGVRLVHDTSFNPGTAWTDYSVEIHEWKWRINSLDGDFTDKSILNTVISDLDSFLIRGEFRDGADTGDLDHVVLRYDPTFIGEEAINHQTVKKFTLLQNHPNPFNPRTVISYQLPVIRDVKLTIYNLLGQQVATFVSKNQKAGYHQVQWDASGFASGVYYYRIETDEFQDVKKMVLVR
jgi:hypothetical protein